MIVRSGANDFLFTNTIEGFYLKALNCVEKRKINHPDEP